MSDVQKFYGWRVVAAAFVVAVFGWGVGFYGPPVYLEAVRQAHGWPIALVSGAVTLHFLAGVGVVANLPTLHRRFGLPKVTFAGAVVLALGVLGWAFAQAPWQLFAAALLTGAGWPTMGGAAVNAIVAPWFVARRPAALSMAYNGASIGGVIFSPLWVALIAHVGFPTAAFVVGTGMVVLVGALAILVLGHTPDSVGQVPDGPIETRASPPVTTLPALPVSDLARDRAFITLSFGMALALFAQIGLIAQLVSLLVPAFGTQGAGLAAGLSTAAAIVGRLLVGWCMPPHTDRRCVAGLSLLVQVAGCGSLLLAETMSTPLLFVGVVLIGLGVGNATSLPPLIAQVEFEPGDALRVVALIVSVSQAAYAFAPAVFGLLRQFGSDQAVFLTAAGVQCAAMGVYLLGRNAFHDREGSTRVRPQA